MLFLKGLELKLPKNFINTPENIEKGKILDGPISVDLTRKKKGDGNWATKTTVKLQFKRKITFNGFSFQLWQNNAANKKWKVDEPFYCFERRPRIHSEMFLYMHDNRNQRIYYNSYDCMQKEKQKDDRPNFKWRCRHTTIVSDSIEFLFVLYNDKEREQFEKLLIGDFKIYY